MNIYIIAIGAAVGFLIAKIFSGKKAGEEGFLKSWKIGFGRYIIHFHHWFIAVLILIILFIFNFYSNIVYGFLFGLIIQGLFYKDFYKIIYLRKF